MPSVNVIKLCYYMSGSFLCFQVLTSYWTAYEPLWWINRLTSHVRPFFPDPDRYRGAGSRRDQRWWWPSWPLSINGRVAEQRGAAQPVRVWQQDNPCRGGMWASTGCKSTSGDHKSPCRDLETTQWWCLPMTWHAKRGCESANRDHQSEQWPQECVNLWECV